MKWIAAGLFCALPLLADSYLFTSFRGEGDTGIFLAASTDGKKWTALNSGRPWLKPERNGMIMRDPWLGKGPDGTWHLLWTWGWMPGTGDGGIKIGHASSTNLLDWSRQEEIPVFPGQPEVRNAWAPEAVWNSARAEWLIFWASTIRGRFTATEPEGEGGMNHRIYSMTTKDWKTFTPARLLFDPGYEVIDATMVQDRDKWVMIFKDERMSPVKKVLKIAFAPSPEGPWNEISSKPFTPAFDEGPTAMKIGGDWWIYCDHYASPQHYEAFRTSDWKHFKDVTSQMQFAPGQRHGTVVQVPDSLADSLRSVQR